MHALTFEGTQNITCSVVKDPEIQQPGDVIVKISRASICGSDLHVYHGREAGQDKGTIMGHEFTGVVEESGSNVKKFKKGARVLSPFTTSCGDCFYCRSGLTCRCVKGGLFGWVHAGQGLQGAQAEYIRVPMADSTMLPLSNDLSDEKGLLLGDVFSTGYFCAENAQIEPGGVYVIIGCGPVGLMTVIAARHLGAEKLFAVDTIQERLMMAEEFGAIPLNSLVTDVKEEIFKNSSGRGADAVMEAVGSDKSLRLAMDMLRPGGIISSVGVHTAAGFSFSPIEAYDKNLVYKSGRCPARYYAEKLIREETIQRYSPEKIITHQFSLREGAMGYEVFDKKLDHCLKVALLP